MMLEKSETISWEILNKDSGILGPNEGGQNWGLIMYSQIYIKEAENLEINETWSTYMPFLAWKPLQVFFYVILRIT